MSEMREMRALPPPDPKPLTQRDLVPWAYAAGFLVLAAGVLWLLFMPAAPPASLRVEALEQRLARLEQRPMPGPSVDTAPLAARLAALEQRPAPAPALPDLRPLESRLAALEQRQPPDLGAIITRMEALAGRQDALSARAQSIEAIGIARQEAAEGRLEALERRLAAAEAMAGQVPALAARAARLARLQAVQAALDKGEKLGEIAGAPPALARFATQPPPTEAALRLAFPAAARAASEASVPATSTAPLLERVWTRAQSVITIRQGDQVLLGDASAGVLARARRALEAGDLAGAVTALGDLQGPAAPNPAAPNPAAPNSAAQAMAAWRAEAQALLAARAALAELAARL